MKIHIIVSEGGSSVKDIKMIPKAGKVAAPIFFPVPGTYSSSQKIEISCNTSYSLIYYTLDGSKPDELSHIYEAPFVISESTCINARAYKIGLEPSDIAEGNFVITGKVDNPIFSPEQGTYTIGQQITLSCITSDAVIYYTLDESEPDQNSNRYTNPFLISEATVIRAKAFKPDWLESDTVKALYVITGTVAAPVFSPDPGIYTELQFIRLSSETPDAVIYYTLDGSEPTENSMIYTSLLYLPSNMTVKAKAFKKGWNVSSTATGVYTITGTVSPPSFSPEPGIYPVPQDIELSCSTAGSVIRYTTDGREPTENSILYTKPISVSSGMTIKAKGFKENWIPSTAAAGVYTITGTVAMPLFSPEAGIYPVPQNIELSCDTAGAVIRYTTDGSEPNENSAIYTIPIYVSSGMTVKAKGFKENWITSETAAGFYTITGTVAVPLFLPEPGIYTSPQNVELSCSTAGAVIRYTIDGREPDENSAEYKSRISVSSGMIIKAKGFKENWISSGTSTGIYTITGTVAPPDFLPAPGTYTTIQSVELFTATSGVSIHYTTDGSDPEEYSRLYTEPIVVSSTTAIKAKALKTDWADSSISTGIYTIIQTVERPVFFPLPGLYTEAQQIELSCATSDAVIRYTTDGSDPAEDSLIYVTPIHLSETAVIRAKAFKNGWIASDTATGDYTVTGTVENPIFSLPPDIYTAPQHVILSCITHDASIRYTTDGNEPTEDSPLCKSEIFVKETLTIKAKSFKNMWKPSRTVTQHYIITETENSDSGGCFLNTVF